MLQLYLFHKISVTSITLYEITVNYTNYCILIAKFNRLCHDWKGMRHPEFTPHSD